MLPAAAEDQLFSCLSPADLVGFSYTSKAAHNSVTSYFCRAFQIDKRLRRYFTEFEIKFFRYWQQRTGMLISGSTALQFFDRSFYEGSDLDIYVEHRYCAAIALWLERIGYSFVARLGQDDELLKALKSNETSSRSDAGFFVSEESGYFGRGVSGVYNFYKYHPDRKIQLIGSLHSPLEIILNYHSTCVMNVITHEKAYSFYPLATFEQRRSLIYSTEGSNQESARAKYAKRGWKMIKNVSSLEAHSRSSAFSAGTRYPGDKRCWVISLHPVLDLPSGFIATNTWELKYSETLEPVMSFMLLTKSSLDYCYLVGNGDIAAILASLLNSSERRSQKIDSDLGLLVKWYFESKMM